MVPSGCQPIAEATSRSKCLTATEAQVILQRLYHMAGVPVTRGPEGFKQVVAMSRAGFPDIHFTVEDIIAEGDMVASRFTGTMTHKGEYMGIPPTGKQVTFTGIVFHRIAAGKIAEDWENLDNLGVMQQLGVVPTLG